MFCKLRLGSNGAGTELRHEEGFLYRESKTVRLHFPELYKDLQLTQFSLIRKKKKEIGSCVAAYLAGSSGLFEFWQGVFYIQE